LPSRKLLWFVFLKLYQAEGDLLESDSILSAWAESGNQETPERSAFYNAISDLRSKLKPLGITMAIAVMPVMRSN
jgi:hypothetical protein